MNCYNEILNKYDESCFEVRIQVKQLAEVVNSNVHPVEEINGDNTPVSVVDENSIESLNLKRNTYTALVEAQVNQGKRI